MAGNVPKSRGMFQYVFKHFMDSFKVGKVINCRDFNKIFINVFEIADR